MDSPDERRFFGSMIRYSSPPSACFFWAGVVDIPGEGMGVTSSMMIIALAEPTPQIIGPEQLLSYM